MKLFKIIKVFIFSVVFLWLGLAGAVTPTFNLATTSISLEENASNTIRHQIDITNITDADNEFSAFSITTTGNIFSTNPAPVVSFSTTSVMVSKTLSSTPSTATLYFTSSQILRAQVLLL